MKKIPTGVWIVGLSVLINVVLPLVFFLRGPKEGHYSESFLRETLVLFAAILLFHILWAAWIYYKRDAQWSFLVGFIIALGLFWFGSSYIAGFQIDKEFAQMEQLQQSVWSDSRDMPEDIIAQCGPKPIFADFTSVTSGVWTRFDISPNTDTVGAYTNVMSRYLDCAVSARGLKGKDPILP